MSKFTILIAPACFKGSLSAPEAAQVMAEFLAERLGESASLIRCPVADGGDDTLSVLRSVEPGAELKTACVTGPVASMRVNAEYLWLPEKKTVVIESAQAHGLKLLGDTLAPMVATSYGVGELMRQAIEQHQPDTVVVTAGGSASTDGGLGALQALGVRFEDEAGQTIETPISGGDLCGIHKMVWPEQSFYSGRLLIATDVMNPLLGQDGTATVFAPQKGADSGQCEQLELGLRQVSQVLEAVSEVDLKDLPGVGAAGGLAYGLRHLPRSGIVSGSQWISDALNLHAKIARADLIITGEGRFDLTSLGGKATGNLLAWAGAKPVFILCGQVAAGLDFPPPVYVLPLAQDAHAAKASIANPKAALLARLEAALPLLKTLLPSMSPKPAW